MSIVHALLGILCLLLPSGLSAQRISRDYRDRSMPEVLADLSQASPGQRVIFIYDDLEDYTVTQHVDSLSLADAIRSCIGFYPISLSARGDSVLLVECTQKARNKFIGRLVDERGVPVSYANITLISPSDSSIINKGVSNQNGRFVIPTDSDLVIARISHIAYKPLCRPFRVADVGTIRMETAIERLDSISITAKPANRTESEYRQMKQKIDRIIWDMPLPQFRIDTIPTKYKEAPAVVIAEYDSIEYSQARQTVGDFFSKKSDSKWLQTVHLHRTRYFINNREGARQLAQVTYSTQTDITNYVLYKLTVRGIRIIKPDGTQRIIDTFDLFKPRIHRRRTAATDTIRVAGLEPGDILDVFVYHRYKEPLTPYCFNFPSVLPTLSYEARAVADVHTRLLYNETKGGPHGQVYTDGRGIILAYQIRNYAGSPDSPPARCLLQARRVKDKTAVQQAVITKSPDNQ